MRCDDCHGTGTITLPREPGKTFGYIALCAVCRGHGQVQPLSVLSSETNHAVAARRGVFAEALAAR